MPQASITTRQVAINTRWAMIFPFIASSQSRRAMAAGSPNRSRTRCRAALESNARNSSRLICAGQMITQLVEDVLPQAGRLVIPGRRQQG